MDQTSVKQKIIHLTKSLSRSYWHTIWLLNCSKAVVSVRRREEKRLPLHIMGSLLFPFYLVWEEHTHPGTPFPAPHPLAPTALHNTPWHPRPCTSCSPFPANSHLPNTHTHTYTHTREHIEKLNQTNFAQLEGDGEGCLVGVDVGGGVKGRGQCTYIVQIPITVVYRHCNCLEKRYRKYFIIRILFLFNKKFC